MNTLTFRHTFKSGAECELVINFDAAGMPPQATSLGDAATLRKQAAALDAITLPISSLGWIGGRFPAKSDAAEVRAWLKSVIGHLDLDPGEKRKLGNHLAVILTSSIPWFPQE